MTKSSKLVHPPSTSRPFMVNVTPNREKRGPDTETKRSKTTSGVNKHIRGAQERPVPHGYLYQAGTGRTKTGKNMLHIEQNHKEEKNSNRYGTTLDNDDRARRVRGGGKWAKNKIIAHGIGKNHTRLPPNNGAKRGNGITAKVPLHTRYTKTAASVPLNHRCNASISPIKQEASELG